MSDGTRLVIEKIILMATDRYIAEHKVTRYWDEPLVGFADANSPYFPKLKEEVNPKHLVPQDYMPEAKTVICYFLPYIKYVANTNIEGKEPSKMWIDAYRHSNQLIDTINADITTVLNHYGYKVVSTGYSEEINDAYAMWSQCHVAWIGGLGAFGTNNRVITKRGCCGRFYSVITDMPMAQYDEPVMDDYCYRKNTGGCGKCIERCVSGALRNEGIDYNICREIPLINSEIKDQELCGKCMVGLPCSHRIP